MPRRNQSSRYRGGGRKKQIFPTYSRGYFTAKQVHKASSLPYVVPDKKLVKLRYVQQISLDAGASATAHNLFDAMSLFDPDTTGVGRLFD